ncbi:Cytochrome b561 [Mariprofundus aestuarium]|uniref:Cytochrome b561 n=1 Tax=Mariprofundus aestuarium TaxID=1921086 RepID=A0A2K8KWB9_MARES|nr:cytochrome b [Mariprofundus aestuarium]ATX78942.1 Cytochrome b561 [Mariprofundus aestuarium]
MLRNSSTSYGLIAILMHWSMAIAIFAMFGLGLWMVELNYYDSWYHDAPYIHKAVGMLLLFLLIFRFIWRLSNKRPNLMGEAWERFVALLVHRSHYLLLFAITITGYLIPTAEGVGISVFGWFTVPASFSFTKEQADLIGLIHLYITWAVIGLAAAHAGAALKHHFIDKDNTLLRMLGINKKN